MILLALIAVACGSLLARRFKVFILVPASFSLWLIVPIFAWAEGFSVFQSLAIALLFSTGLQLGYLLTAAVLEYRTQRNNGQIVATP